MHRSTQHRSTPWLSALGLIVAVAVTGCTSGSGSSTGSSTAQVSAGGTAGSSPVASVAAGADVFSCPSASEINALTAKGFTAAPGNGADHCEYVVTTGSTQAVRVTIDHPPASAYSMYETLAQFRTAVVAAGNVVLTTAPQYSAESFIAQYGTLSCSVFALARDGQVMQVQATHRTPVPLDDCALAQSVTAVAGTATRAASSAPASGPAASSQVAASSGAPAGTPPASTAPASTTSVAPSPTPSPTPPAPTSRPTTQPTTPSTTRPTTRTTTSEVLIFSTGPAASFTLPTPRPSTTPTTQTR